MPWWIHFPACSVTFGRSSVFGCHSVTHWWSSSSGKEIHSSFSIHHGVRLIHVLASVMVRRLVQVLVSDVCVQETGFPQDRCCTVLIFTFHVHARRRSVVVVFSTFKAPSTQLTKRRTLNWSTCCAGVTFCWKVLCSSPPYVEFCCIVARHGVCSVNMLRLVGFSLSMFA